MGDRHHQPVRPAITASARILQPVSQDTPKKQPWHDDAWGFRDVVGELRFAEMWLGNAFSRSRLIAARRPAPGEEPQPVDSGPAFDAVARLANGVGGQAARVAPSAPAKRILAHRAPGPIRARSAGVGSPTNAKITTTSPAIAMRIAMVVKLMTGRYTIFYERLWAASSSARGMIVSVGVRGE